MDISMVKNIFDSILAGKFTKEHVELLREQLLLFKILATSCLKNRLTAPTLAHLTALNVKSH